MVEIDYINKKLTIQLNQLTNDSDIDEIDALCLLGRRAPTRFLSRVWLEASTRKNRIVAMSKLIERFSSNHSFSLLGSLLSYLLNSNVSLQQLENLTLLMLKLLPERKDSVVEHRGMRIDALTATVLPSEFLETVIIPLLEMEEKSAIGITLLAETLISDSTALWTESTTLNLLSLLFTSLVKNIVHVLTGQLNVKQRDFLYDSLDTTMRTCCERLSIAISFENKNVKRDRIRQDVKESLANFSCAFSLLQKEFCHTSVYHRCARMIFAAYAFNRCCNFTKYPTIQNIPKPPLLPLLLQEPKKNESNIIPSQSVMIEALTDMLTFVTLTDSHATDSSRNHIVDNIFLHCNEWCANDGKTCFYDLFVKTCVSLFLKIELSGKVGMRIFDIFLPALLRNALFKIPAERVTDLVSNAASVDVTKVFVMLQILLSMKAKKKKSSSTHSFLCCVQLFVQTCKLASSVEKINVNERNGKEILLISMEALRHFHEIQNVGDQIQILCMTLLDDVIEKCSLDDISKLKRLISRLPFACGVLFERKILKI
eukprot:g2545.t1